MESSRRREHGLERLYCIGLRVEVYEPSSRAFEGVQRLNLGEVRPSS